MAFTLDARPAEGNIYCKPNEHLRFGYPVKNLDGTPYNEPSLVDVWVTVYAHENSTVELEKYTFLNGTSHANGTNVIAFDLVIDLPKGKYFCTIDHRRTINAVVESNVMFSGFFDVSHKNRSNCSITECLVSTTNIVNIEGLREELDLRPKIKRFTLDILPTHTINIPDGDFLNNPPMVAAYGPVNGYAPYGISDRSSIVILSNTSFRLDILNFDCNKIVVIY